MLTEQEIEALREENKKFRSVMFSLAETLNMGWSIDKDRAKWEKKFYKMAKGDFSPVEE